MDYRSEVICKLNDIVKWKDEELIKAKQDLIKLNDNKTFEENISLREDIRQKGNHTVR